MKTIHDTSVRTLLASALVLCGLMFGLTAGLNLMSKRDTDATFDLVKRVNVQEFGAASAAKNVLDRARLAVDVAEYDEGLATAGNAGAKLGEAATLLGAAADTAGRFTAFTRDAGSLGAGAGMQLARAFSAAIAALQAHEAALRKHDAAALSATRNALAATTTDLEAAFAAFTKYSDQRFSEATLRTEQQETRFSWITMGTVAGALALLALVYFSLRRLVIAPLAEAGDELQRIARADLSHNVRAHGRNEIGELFSGLNAMQDSLRRIVANVRDGCDSIFTGASEISKGNIDLSARTEEQAASVTETASSTEQITSTVKQTADNAQQASGLANDASTTAHRGGEVMSQVATTMHQIADRSRKVEEITGMIDAIAFQTNILALNASVEAARAGDQGRGFAVVASEVRNLAGRSGTAARDIKQLIEDSSTQIHAGVELVDRATATMAEVVSAVKRVTALMDEISAASHEQSAGVAQIGQAMSQMDEVTQQNAALVQQTATAAASLEDQAKRLRAEVAVFQLPEGKSPRPPERSVPAIPEVTAMTRRLERMAVSGQHSQRATHQTASHAGGERDEWSSSW